MTHPSTPAADVHKFGAYADKIGHWTDGPETYVICKAKHVKLGAQTYGPPPAATREAALIAERDQLRAMVEDVSKEVHMLRAALVDIAEETDDPGARECASAALSAPASVEGV